LAREWAKLGGYSAKNVSILVVGASDEVVSIAVVLHGRLGLEARAPTAKILEQDFSKSPGAAAILDRAESSGEGKHLGKERYAAAVDSIGGQTLADVPRAGKIR
jgi:acrylyl-CoA reductase (NADPH)